MKIATSLRDPPGLHGCHHRGLPQVQGVLVPADRTPGTLHHGVPTDDEESMMSSAITSRLP